MQDALVLEGVTAGYSALSSRAHVGDSPDGGKSELDQVDLRVSPGEMVCVLGPNGAGKTTLVRVASGLLQPRSGNVLLWGEALPSRSRADVARILAVVEQVQDISAAFTVREVVAMGRAPHQTAWMRATEEDQRIVDEALKRCDLLHLASRPARALSGGEQKRVAVARALAQGPKVLLLDEPGAFLDVRHQLDLYELLASEVKERKMACLVVMHDLNVAAQFADRIVLMKAGRVVASGTVADVMTWATLKQTFDTDLYCGVNDLTGVRFFLPMRRSV